MRNFLRKKKADGESKYHAKKCEFNGKTFASKKEMKRYIYLLDLQEKGEITGLETQKKYVLIPAQKEDDVVVITPKGKEKIVKGKCLERECAYYADFVYIDKENQLVVEDTKGFITPEYIIKRKLMLFEFNIRIKEL